MTNEIKNITINTVKLTDKSLNIIRDDLLDGGTKVRGLLPYMRQIISNNPKKTEFIYPSPVFGYAQVALAVCCKLLEKDCTIFVAKRAQKHPNTKLAESFGATIIEVPFGRLVVVKKRLLDYVYDSPITRQAMPWGLDNEQYRECLKESITHQFPAYEKIEDVTFWVCVGSGTLFKTLAQAFPKAKFNLVLVGADYTVENEYKEKIANVFRAPEKYEQMSKSNPPYPSNKWYDAKLWQFVVKHAKDGDFVWNVAS